MKTVVDLTSVWDLIGASSPPTLTHMESVRNTLLSQINKPSMQITQRICSFVKLGLLFHLTYQLFTLLIIAATSCRVSMSVVRVSHPQMLASTVLLIQIVLPHPPMFTPSVSAVILVIRSVQCSLGIQNGKTTTQLQETTITITTGATLLLDLIAVALPQDHSRIWCVRRQWPRIMSSTMVLSSVSQLTLMFTSSQSLMRFRIGVILVVWLYYLESMQHKAHWWWYWPHLLL